MARLVLLDPTAELDEIFVGIHHAALDGLRCSRIVSTLIQGHPAALILFQLTYCWPGQSTAHALNLSPRVHVLGKKCLGRIVGGARNARSTPLRKAPTRAGTPEVSLDYTPTSSSVKERPSKC